MKFFLVEKNISLLKITYVHELIKIWKGAQASYLYYMGTQNIQNVIAPAEVIKCLEQII